MSGWVAKLGLEWFSLTKLYLQGWQWNLLTWGFFRGGWLPESAWELGMTQPAWRKFTMLLFALYYGLFIIIIMTSEFWKKPSLFKGFPGGLYGEEPAYIAGDPSSIPGLGRSPGGGNGNPLQDSCLEKSLGQRSLAGYSPGGCKESSTAQWQHFTSLHSLFRNVGSRLCRSFYDSQLLLNR